jgi:hypothetical protein
MMHTFFSARAAGHHVFHLPSLSNNKSNEGMVISIVIFFAIIGCRF